MPWNKSLYPPLLFVSVRELPRVAVGISPRSHRGKETHERDVVSEGQGACCTHRPWPALRAGGAGRDGPGVGAARLLLAGCHRRLGGSPGVLRRWRMPHTPANAAGAALPRARGGMLPGHVSEPHLPCALSENFSAAQLVQRRMNNGEGRGRGGESRRPLRRCGALRIKPMETPGASSSSLAAGAEPRTAPSRRGNSSPA